MKRIFIKTKPFIKYLLIFFLFLIWNLIVQPVNLDEIWNYGFSYNIYNGLIPYKDFNMVITPLYPMIMAFAFFVLGSNMLSFHIINSLILTIGSFFLFKLFDNKAWLLILLFFIPLSVAYPSYNVFLLFLFIILLYLENNNFNDYVIGFFLALLILTKQSVGVCLVLVSLFYINEKKKIIKRLIGIIFPIICFLVYLLVTNSFYNFLDLCFFGLFDFAKGNGHFINIFVIFMILMIIINLWFIKNNPRNIFNYYTLAFYTMMIPLFDMYHFQVSFIVFCMCLLFNSNKSIRLNYSLFTVSIIVLLSIINFYSRFSNQKVIYPNNIKYFEYRLIDEHSINFTNDINQFIAENSDKEFVFLNSNGYYFRLINDMKIGYIDLINTGNWGYNGSDKLFLEVKKKKSAVFIVDKSELSEIKQIDKRVLKYVMENGKKVNAVGIYDIYVFE